MCITHLRGLRSTSVRGKLFQIASISIELKSGVFIMPNCYQGVLNGLVTQRRQRRNEKIQRAYLKMRSHRKAEFSEIVKSGNERSIWFKRNPNQVTYRATSPHSLKGFSGSLRCIETPVEAQDFFEPSPKNTRPTQPGLRRYCRNES